MNANRPYLRTGSFGEFICDRYVNIPDHNEEHTQAQVNELYHVTVQILADSFPGMFRPILLKTLPRYEPNRGQLHRLDWEKKTMAWEKTLTKREREARGTMRICWPSISRSLRDDMRRAAERRKDRRA